MKEPGQIAYETFRDLVPAHFPWDEIAPSVKAYWAAVEAACRAEGMRRRRWRRDAYEGFDSGQNVRYDNKIAQRQRSTAMTFAQRHYTQLFRKKYPHLTITECYWMARRHAHFMETMKPSAKRASQKKKSQ